MFLRNDNCPSMLVWGISDNHSWRQNSPLLFDSSLKPKPAYYNVHAQLRKAAEKAADGIVSPENPDNGAKIVSTTLYDLSGRRISTPKGIVIERNVYSDGSVKVVKR